MAAQLKDDDAFDALDGIRELFKEHEDNDIMNAAKNIPKKKVPYSKKKKVPNKKKKVPNKKKLDQDSKIDFNKDTKTIDKKILELLEERRNIGRMRARKEHGDPNGKSQGTKICRHFNSRNGCKYGRQCDMKHPPIITDLTESIFQCFMTVINAPTEDQVAFLERNKKRPQHFYRGSSQQHYRREIPQFYSRGKPSFNFRSNAKYKGKYKNTEKKSDD